EPRVRARGNERSSRAALALAPDWPALERQVVVDLAAQHVLVPLGSELARSDVDLALVAGDPQLDAAARLDPLALEPERVALALAGALELEPERPVAAEPELDVGAVARGQRLLPMTPR